MEITKELVESLLSDDIKHKEYLEIICQINYKVEEIWKYIIKASDRKMIWWDFEGHEDGGNFDPHVNQDDIEITGDFSECGLIGYEYNNGFPTELLWSDYKSVIEAHIEKAKKDTEEHKKKQLEKRNLRKIDKVGLIKQIKAKLTPEELKIVKFK
jgi:hypothetical protein